MPNDPLPSPDVFAAPTDADYEAVIAALAATERGRNFLAEYARRHGHPDTRKLVRTIARLEAAVRAGPPPQVPTAFARGLADLAALIGRIEAMLAPSASSSADIHFAIERIQDIATAVRKRDVEAALCDLLEAALREVGDAIVCGDAAASRAASAVHLLRDLARRVDEMMALLAAAQAGAAHPAGDATPQSAIAQSDDTAPVIEAARPADKPAPSEPKEEPRDLFEPLSLPVPSPLEAASATPPAVEPPPAEAVPQPRIDVDLDIGAAARPVSRVSDPLAPLFALSEEELIALFS